MNGIREFSLINISLLLIFNKSLEHIRKLQFKGRRHFKHAMDLRDAVNFDHNSRSFELAKSKVDLISFLSYDQESINQEFIPSNQCILSPEVVCI